MAHHPISNKTNFHISLQRRLYNFQSAVVSPNFIQHVWQAHAHKESGRLWNLSKLKIKFILIMYVRVGVCVCSRDGNDGKRQAYNGLEGVLNLSQVNFCCERHRKLHPYFFIHCVNTAHGLICCWVRMWGGWTTAARDFLTFTYRNSTCFCNQANQNERMNKQMNERTLTN